MGGVRAVPEDVGIGDAKVLEDGGVSTAPEEYLGEKFKHIYL